MLHYFRFRNFLSFMGEAEISFRLNRHAPNDRRSFVSPTGQQLSKLLAVVGPNASGKTNLIKPLSFLTWFVRDSFRVSSKSELLVEPHFFAPQGGSEFEAEFEMEGELYRYTLNLTAERVLSEALYVKTSRYFSYLFRRDWQSEQVGYQIKQKRFGLSHAALRRVRDNASLISTAAQFQVELATRLVDYLQGVYTNIDYWGRQPYHYEDLFRASDFYLDHETERERMIDLLRRWDLGLTDLVIERHKPPDEPPENREIAIPFGLHRGPGRTVKRSLLQESNGTQSAYVLLSRILPALRTGGLVIIDELESDLHTHLVAEVLELFLDERTNPHNAQMLFTSHTLEILNLLHKSQVMLVRKTGESCSEAWRLDEMQGVRNDENLYSKYLAGAYGAVPDI